MIEILAQAVTDPSTIPTGLLEKGGFVGFCGVLISFLFWLVKRLLEVLQENTKVIASNTAAIQQVGTTATESLKLHQENHDLLISRPCIKEDK